MNDLIGKFSNIYLMLLFGVMKQDLKDIKHYLNEDVYNKYNKMILEDKANNERHMFDEPNVYKIRIIDQKELDDRTVVTVELISRYLDYYTDLENDEYVRGNAKSRDINTNILTFEKLHNVKESKIYFACPHCGASLSVNHSGYCEYCHKTVDMKDYDYILTSIETYPGE